jgi:hypothetical protein
MRRRVSAAECGAMIRAKYISNVFDPGRSAVEVVEVFRDGMVAADLAPRGWDGLARYFLGLREVQADHALSDGDGLVVVAVPAGFTVPQLLTYVALLASSYFISRALMPKPPRQRDDATSPTYGFQGIRTNRVEGEPIQAYYGKIRAGGQIINEYVESRGQLGSFYNALISYGHGPIRSIMGLTADTPVDTPLRTGSGTSEMPRGYLWINEMDAADIEGAEVHVRLGSLEQEPVIGFEFTSQTITIDSSIRGPVAADDGSPEWVFAGYNRIPQLADDGITSSDGLWEAYGESYDMQASELADEFTVVVEFPLGLSRIDDNTGAVQDWFSALAVRYIELDGNGNPITTGGPEGDGYVRLRAWPTFTATIQVPFTNEWRFPFYDPQLYTYTTLGKVYRAWHLHSALPDAEAYAQRTEFLPTPLQEVTDGTRMGDFSLECWVQLRPTDPRIVSTGGNDLPDTDLTSPSRLVHWMKTTPGGQRGGFALAFDLRTFTASPGHTRQRIVPVLRLCDSSGTEYVIFEKQNELGLPSGVLHLAEQGDSAGAYARAETWKQVIVTYKRHAIGTVDRARIYVDGVMSIEEYGVFDVGFPAASTGPLVGTTFYLGRNPNNSAHNFHGWADELVLWSGEMNADDVRRAYAGGAGRPAPANPVLNIDGSTRLTRVVRWSFDSGGGTGGDQTIPGFDDSQVNTYALTTVYAGSAPAAAAMSACQMQGFIDTLGSTNTHKKGRYRVEVMRGLRNQTTASKPDTMRWRNLILHTNDLLAYPETALIGVKIPASSQVNGALPNITALIEGRIVKVWDQNSVENPTFLNEYSDNPAWCAVDLLLSPTFGIGWAVKNRHLIVQSFQDAADYFNEPVYDQRGRRLEYPLWSNMRYSATLISGLYPGIEISMSLVDLPKHWKVGGFIAWYGTPAITAGGGPFQDTNVADASAPGGYEIAKITKLFTAAFVQVRWTGSLPPWNEGQYLSTQITGGLAGTIEGRERRFVTSWALDSAGSAWEKLIELLLPARTVPRRVGSQIKLIVDRPRDAIDLITLAQVEPGSFQVAYESSRTKVNAIDVQFLDEDLNFERSLVPYEDPEIQSSADLSKIRRRSVSIDSCSRRSQILRHAMFLVRREAAQKRRIKLRGSMDLIGYEPGDVIVVSHDVMARGIGGRILEDSADTTHVKLDRSVTIEAGISYKLLVRRASMHDGVPPESADVDEAATGIGVHPIGDTITLASPFAREPAKNDVYIFYAVGSDLQVTIDSITTTPDMRREIEASQYDATVYDVEGIDISPNFEDEFDTEGLATGRGSPPGAPRSLRVSETRVTSASGGTVPGAALSWEPPDSESPIGGYDVYIGRSRGGWRRAARSGPEETRAIVSLESFPAGARADLSVVAVSPLGAARAPDSGALAWMTISAREAAPPAPSSLWPSMIGDLATYRLVSGSASRTITHQLRRGGWIVGQVIGSITHGGSELGPTSDWVSASNSLTQTDAAPIYARARSDGGSWSHYARQEWAPRAISSASVSDLTADYSVAWEDFGDGWRWTGPIIPNTTLDGLQVDSDNVMRFSGSVLTGTYTTAVPVTLKNGMAEPFYVSAFAVADQVSPVTWEESPATWNESHQHTWEGALDEVEDGQNQGRCTLTIQVKYLEGDMVWSDWRDYSPSRTTCVAAQFRIVVTRPTSAWDVVISRFSTELLRAPQGRWEESPLQSWARARVLRRG